MYIDCRLAHLTGVFKNHVDLVLHIILFIWKAPTNFKIESVNTQSRSPRTLIKRKSADMVVRIYPKL